MFERLFYRKKRKPVTNKYYTKTIFLNLFSDWLEFAQQEINIVEGLFDQNSISITMNELQDNLIHLVERVLHIEYQVFLEQANEEATDNRNFLKEFENKLLERDYRIYLLNEYPELFKLAAENIKLFVSNINEIVKKFQEDQKEISFSFNIATSKIEYIRLGLGDKHNGHKTVSIVHFINGNKIVFKPRKLNIEKKLQLFIEYYNSVCLTNIYVPKTIISENYGWVEFIDTDPITNFQHYYINIGHVLGILYVLNGTDFHYDNILYNRDKGVVLIDCEAVFYPILNNFNEFSVLSIGLLPNRIDIGNDQVNMGGVNINNSDEEQDISSITVEDIYIDEKGINSNIVNPKIGKSIDYKYDYNSKNYVDNIITGFTESYQFFVKNNKVVINFFTNSSDDIVIRYLVRHTIAYSHLLYESLSPINLTDTQKRIDLLSNLSLSFEYHNHHRITFNSELKSLENCDIPYFYSNFNNKKLYTNNEIICDDFFASSPYEAFLIKINSLNKEDLKKHTLLIQYSFSQSTKRNSYNIFTDNYIEKNVNSYYLFFTSLVNNDNSYFSLKKSYSRDHEYKLDLTDSTLLHGKLGDLIVLAEANKIFPNKEISNIIQRIYGNISFNYSSIGMAGIAGTIYFYVRMYIVEGENSYLNEAISYLNQIDIRAKIINSKNSGLVNGKSGLLIALLNLNKYIKNNDVIEIIHFLYQKLTESIIFSKAGTYWLPENIKSPLSGVAHGSSGIVLALFNYYLTFETFETLDLIKQSIQFENSYYNSKFKNWKDNRDFITNHSDKYQSFGWSHGAPGIGLLRLEIIKSGIYKNDTFNKILKTDLINCVNSTILQGFKGNDSVIFGKYGNAELIFRYSRLFKINDILSDMEQNLSSLNDVYLIENNKGLMIPGLFNGVSGCIHQLLYFNNIIKNSILTFD